MGKNERWWETVRRVVEGNIFNAEEVDRFSSVGLEPVASTKVKHKKCMIEFSI